MTGNFFYPGGGIEAISDRVGGLVKKGDVVCIVAGGNDVQDGRSEDLIRRYREALEKVRMEGGSAVACGILPRFGYSREWASRALGINQRIEKYCRDNNVAYVDGWEYFHGYRKLYARDGVHFSRLGVSVLAGLIDRAVGFC